MSELLWQPSAERIARATITAFMRQTETRYSRQFVNYADLYQWSLDEKEKFWSMLWDFCEVIASERGERVLLNAKKMPGAQWFPDAKLNFAQNLLRRRDAAGALVFWGEDRVRKRCSYAELYDAVTRLAQALREQGVKPGDRVAAYLPNMPETVIAMLAAASIGAIWSSCSPDFGVQGVLDRFSQIEPCVLFAVNGYYYNGKEIEVSSRVADIAMQLPSLRKVIIVPYLGAAQSITIKDAVLWDDFIAAYSAREIEFAQLPFNHPLYILYSSGTTGAPKCIVHGAGGTLLQHIKEHLLHCDIKRDDRVFYFTTCGWMMWNWLISALARQATVLLFDGSPFIGRGKILWDYAEAERITHFGTSAKYLDAAKKIDLAPHRTHRLTNLRTVLSTGSPLAPEGFDYVYQSIKQDVCLSSVAGGTDIISCFVAGCPILPVWRGEIQCRALGMQVEVFDDEGRSLKGAQGELVCTAPFPSMPIGFWNDQDGSKYHAAYFAKYPDVWCHGDWVELTEHDGMIIYGRSDATLNPGGVRIGTAEIYRQVEQLDEVMESLVIGQDWDNDVRVVLFVRLREGLLLDDVLGNKIKQGIRINTSPRHVPAKIIQVADIPRTKSNKIVELAVRHIVHGRPVKNVEALANPEALDYFRDLPELKT